jgi:hypothetical protein
VTPARFRPICRETRYPRMRMPGARSPFIPAKVLSERPAVADGKLYSFFFETDFAGRVKAGPQIETWQRRSVAGLHASRDSLYRTAGGR